MKACSATFNQCSASRNGALISRSAELTDSFMQYFDGETMSTEETKWKDAQLNELQGLVDTFNKVDTPAGPQYILRVQNILDKDKNL